MSNELVVSTRGKGELFGLLWTFVIGLIIWSFLSFTSTGNSHNLISISMIRFCMFIALFVLVLIWGFRQTLFVPIFFELNSVISLSVQHINHLVFLHRFNVAETEVISKDIGSDHRPIWGQLELGNRLIAKRCKWKFKNQKTIQRERQS
jgi:hypothetical protein